MAQQQINIGTPNGNDGDFVRNSFNITNNNFTDLYLITPKTGTSTTDPNVDPNAASLVTTYPNTPLFWILTGGVNPVRYQYNFTTSSWILDNTSLDTVLIDGSANPVQNNAVYDESRLLRSTINRATIADKLNNIYSTATIRGIGTIITDFTTLTYDRGIIYCRDNTNSYLLIRNTSASGDISSQFRSQVLNGDGRKFWWAIQTQISVTGGLNVIENRVYGFVTNTAVTITGLNANYTAYIYESDIIPIDFDATDTSTTFVNISLINPRPISTVTPLFGRAYATDVPDATQLDTTLDAIGQRTFFFANIEGELYLVVNITDTIGGNPVIVRDRLEGFLSVVANNDEIILEEIGLENTTISTVKYKVFLFSTGNITFDAEVSEGVIYDFNYFITNTTVDINLSTTSQAPLQNSSVTSALNDVSTTVSGQAARSGSAQAIQFRVNQGILPTGNLSSIVYDSDLIFIDVAFLGRFALVRRNNFTSINNQNFINTFFNFPGRSVAIRCTRNQVLQSEPLLSYVERVVYGVYETTPTNLLSNINANYTGHFLTPEDIGNLQVSIANPVTPAQGALVQMSWHDIGGPANENLSITKNFNFTNSIPTTSQEILPAPGFGKTYSIDKAIIQLSLNSPFTGLNEEIFFDISVGSSLYSSIGVNPTITPTNDFFQALEGSNLLQDSKINRDNANVFLQFQSPIPAYTGGNLDIQVKLYYTIEDLTNAPS